MQRFIEIEELKNRRNEFASRMKEDSVAVLFAGLPKIKSADETYPFEVNRNFYYLTGIDQEESVLLISNSDGIYKEVLFVSPFDERKRKWTGDLLSFDEARDLSGVHDVLPTTAFMGYLEGVLDEKRFDLGPVSHFYFDHDKEIKIGEEMAVSVLGKETLKKFPYLKEGNLYPIVTALRLKKSAAEISLFKRAISATKEGIEAAVSKFHDKVHEYELADAFLAEVNDQTAYQGLAFSTIVAGGKNAAILHYPTPLDEIEDGNLVLFDLGARYGYYCADVSRTFPINGEFSPFQKELYELVLSANKKVIAAARPGVSIKELQDLTKKTLAAGLIKMKLIEKEEDIDKYYFHGVSHLIGLDTHDPYMAENGDTNYKEMPLEAGMVISDEPGLYIEEKGIGIRIEDDLYISETGCIVLTAGIPKEVNEVEALVKSLRK